MRAASLAKAKAIRADADFDFIHVFCRRDAELEAVIKPLKRALRETGMIWISWPKRTKPSAANVDPAALDEKTVRRLGLAAGLVDVKVCAVDETWSGLKFVYRLKDRKN